MLSVVLAVCPFCSTESAVGRRPPVQRREALEVERAAVVNTKSSGDLPFIPRRRIVTTDGAMVMVRRDFGVLGMPR